LNADSETLKQTLKPGLLLLPGLHGKGDLFRPLMDKLGDRYDLSAVSYPQTVPMGYEALFDLVTSRIKREKTYIILGESFSGPLAVRTAAKFSKQVKGLILAGSFVTSPIPHWINTLKPFLNTPLLYLRPVKWVNERLMGSSCPEGTRKWIHASMPRLSRDVLATRIREVMAVDVRQELKDYQGRLLYMAGARDWLVGKGSIESVWLCRPDVEIRVIDGVHMFLETNAKDSADAINEFCSRISGVEGDFER